MSNREFWADVIASSAWPLVVVVLALSVWFSLGKWLKNPPEWWTKWWVENRLTKLSAAAGPQGVSLAVESVARELAIQREAHFEDAADRPIDEVVNARPAGEVAGASATRVRTGPDTWEWRQDPPLSDEKADRLTAEWLTSLAADSPEAAVVHASREIERQLRRILGADLDDPPSRMGLVAMANRAADLGRITEHAESSVERLARLRNVAIHSGDLLSAGQAELFVRATIAAVAALSERPETD